MQRGPCRDQGKEGRRQLTASRLVAIFMLGWLLFNYPLLVLFGRVGQPGGVPSLYLYLFMAWAAIILLVAVAVERAGPPDGD